MAGMVIVAVILIAVLAVLGAVASQSVVGLQQDAGELIRGKKPQRESVLTGDRRRDAIEAFSQIGLDGDDIEDYVDRAIALCPDCSLQSIVNLVMQMRSSDGAK